MQRDQSKQRVSWGQRPGHAVRASHLAIEHALLLEAQILGGVGHYGEGGFGIMPEGKRRKHTEITSALV